MLQKNIVEGGKVCLQLLLRTGWHVQTRARVLWAWQPWRDNSPAGTARGGRRDGAADLERGLGFSLQLLAEKRFFPQCKRPSNPCFRVGLSVPTRQRRLVSKVHMETDGGRGVCPGARHEPIAGLAGAS